MVEQPLIRKAHTPAEGSTAQPLLVKQQQQQLQHEQQQQPRLTFGNLLQHQHVSTAEDAAAPPGQQQQQQQQQPQLELEHSAQVSVIVDFDAGEPRQGAQGIASAEAAAPHHGLRQGQPQHVLGQAGGVLPQAAGRRRQRKLLQGRQQQQQLQRLKVDFDLQQQLVRSVC